MASDPAKPSVVERGAYSETGAGPQADTTAWVSEAGPEAPVRTPEPGASRGASARIDRDKLARSRPPAPAEPESSRWKVAVIAGVVALVVLVGSVATLSARSEPAPAPAPAPVEPATPEAPRELQGGIKVERGLKRQPLPPKQVKPSAPGAPVEPAPSAP